VPIDPEAMRIFDDLRSGLTPAVEDLHQSWDKGRFEPLRGRELAAEAATAGAFLAVAVALAVLVPAERDFDLPLAATLVATYVLLARVHFPIGYGFTIPTQLVLVPMLFLVPLGAVPLLVAAGMVLGGVPEYVSGDRHPTRALAAIGDSWHAVGPVAVLAAGGVTAPELGDWPLLLAALAAQVLTDNGVASLRDWAGLGVSLKLQPQLFGWVTLVDVLLSPVGLLAAMAAVSEPYAVLLVLPLAALLLVFALERGARVRQAIELSRAYRGTTLLLSDVLEVDDEYTGFHSRSVVSLSVAVSDTMGLSSRQRRNVEFGALLHDVGKIAVPKEIINKPGPLTDDEWLVIKTHTIEGQRMLDRVGGLLSEVGKIVRSSHEKWDGSGYPDGLRAGEIPVESTIVSCCDAFDAMITDRSYRAAMSLDEAIAELQANAGTQFNPDVVDALMRLLKADPLTAGARGPRVAAVA
jgi:HD-GYP domain-containing protein (c-di-GMP phosphodiesterase class II)